VCAVCASVSSGFTGLVLSRFLLGLAEGGVQPALMTTIRAWFPFDERSRAYSVFKLYAPIAALVTAPTAGLILQYGTWRELFLVQGAVPVVVGVVLWVWLVRDTPARARWISPAEHDHIAAALRAEGVPGRTAGQAAGGGRLAFTNRMVWLFTAAYSLTLLGMYGILMWLPTLLGRSFGSDAKVGVTAMAPSVVGAVAIMLVGRSADRRGHHVAHVCWTLGIGSVTLVAASCLSADQRWLVLAAMIIATASSLAYYGPMWAMVTRLVPVSALAIGIGIINGVGNLGGFVGPYVGGVLIDLTGSMVAAQLFFAAALLGAAVIIFSLRGQMRAAVGELAERTPVR
jgi:MFS family permease